MFLYIYYIHIYILRLKDFMKRKMKWNEIDIYSWQQIAEDIKSTLEK